MSKNHVAKYIARSSAIASRMLGGEMMIMSAVDSTFFMQITNDGADKMSVFAVGSVPPPMVTDGSRLYFSERRGDLAVLEAKSVSSTGSGVKDN